MKGRVGRCGGFLTKGEGGSLVQGEAMGEETVERVEVGAPSTVAGSFWVRIGRGIGSGGGRYAEGRRGEG